MNDWLIGRESVEQGFSQRLGYTVGRIEGHIMKSCQFWVRVSTFVILGVVSIGCKPKPPVDNEALRGAVQRESALNQPSAQSNPPSAAASANGASGAAALPAALEPAASTAAEQHHSQHAPHGTDINEVANKLDAETKADIYQRIEQRNHAKPEVSPLPGGGTVVQLNGSHHSVAVAVKNESGEAVVYHHGEALKAPASTEALSNATEQKSAPPQTVKPYPAVKQITLPSRSRD